MKRYPAVLRLVLLASATLPHCGCFSGLARMGEAWGGKVSTETKVLAGAADVATLPLQAPVLVLEGVQHASSQAARAKREEALKQIRTNPDYIFQHQLHRPGNDEGLYIVFLALQDESVPFTDAQLRRLYQEMKDWQRFYVLANSHCSVAFLQEIWGPINAGQAQAGPEIVAQLVRNPSLPLEWLEVMAQDENKFGRTSANEYLRKRRLTMDTDGNGMTDGWEIEKFGHIGVDPQGDPDGDGLTNLQEFKQGTDPNDFYNGIQPIVSGGGKPDASGALVLIVRKPDGSPWPFAPVTFEITTGYNQLSAQPGGPDYAKQVKVNCDENGVAKAYLKWRETP